MATLQLDLPDDLVTTLTATDEQAVREAAVVKLYDLGRINVCPCVPGHAQC